MTPLGMRGVLNDALSIYFGDAPLASAFVARWCVGANVETAGGVFRVREDVTAPRVGAGRATRRGMINAPGCFACMDRASHYRHQADHARRLADATWQPDLADMLRHLAQDFDETAEDIEAGTTEVCTPSFCPRNLWVTPSASARDRPRAPRQRASSARYVR